MRQWQTAGVQGGIPFLSSSPIRTTISATNSSGINSAINSAAYAGGGQVVLRNGTYTINQTVKMKSNVRLVGESRNGVTLLITMGSGTGVNFDNISKAGLDNLTIRGDFGVPNDFVMESSKPSAYNTSVNIDGDTQNCWLDNVTILNSGRHPINISGDHNTVRGSHIERVGIKTVAGRVTFRYRVPIT